MYSNLVEQLRKLLLQHATWRRADEIAEFLKDLESQPAHIGEIADPREAIEVWLRLDALDSGYDLTIGLEGDLAKEIAKRGFMAVAPSGRALLCIDEQSASRKLRESVVQTFRIARESDVPDTEHPDQDGMFIPWTQDGAGLWREQESRPSWAPIVLGSLEGEAPVSRPTVLWVGSEVELIQGSERTGIAEAITKMVDHGLLLEDFNLNKELDEHVVWFLDTANDLYEMILGKPLGLDIETGGPSQIHRGTHPRLMALDSGTSQLVPLDRLSATESRWAKVAFLLAWNQLQPQRFGEDDNWDSSTCVLLIDEPELGLAWGMQRQLSSGLVALSEHREIPVIVATHSAALLDDLAVRTFRCSRSDTGSVRVDEVLSTDRDALASLGVPISEELQLHRLVLIVEGRHEEVLLNEMFSEEIAANRIKLLPIRGVRQLRLLAASGELLFRYLDVPFVLLTDRTRTERVERALDAARLRGATDDTKRAMEEIFDTPSDEEQVLRSLLISAAESDRIDRIRAIHGFEKDDILHYLPCEHFDPGSKWDELLDLHKAQTKGPKDFKRWLEVTRDVDLSDEHLRSAIHKMDQIPIEWTTLINKCVEIANPQDSS
ncbi:ATP-binding protein [bacterium]|nr:ATP-binding protein [bacterium]